ncbi:thioredoxin family protein [Microbacter margulisiae]|uniref:Thioredoxin-like negative regulator of GroEL n=1 Tax=Microbacter margulisiae TaxID=1350067 RepID=A0A7W5H1D3_9PORP|nr:thioredoxin family protein [Microbacter margulisiae]MBB3186514.1 thioredoxin-like negative regulator of GroEL [Microbacter margulisiae]
MTHSYETIYTLGEFESLVEKEDALLVYFSHEQCNVCKVLKPKVAQLLHDQFPKMKMVYADTEKSPEIAGQNRIFAVPTIVVFLGGREFFRRSRNIGINELAALIERPYQMMFEA